MSAGNYMSAKDRRRHRRQVTERDGPYCHWCGAPDAETLDHLVPRAAGGSNANANLVLACDSCNQSHGREQSRAGEPIIRKRRRDR